MKFGSFLFMTLSALMLFGTTAMLEAQKQPVVRVYRQDSQSFPIEVVSRDPVMNQWIIRQADEVTADVLRLLGLTEVPFMKLGIRWRPGNADGLLSFPRRLAQRQGKSEIEIDLSGANRSQAVAIKRSVIIAMLQAHVWQGVSEITGEVIPEPPLWLSEGLLWYSVRYAHEDWAQVVSKASRIGKVPSLKDIQQWQELSDLPLERIWQQAFSYCLTRRALQSRAEKAAVLLWVKNFRHTDAGPFWAASPEVENWWQEEADRQMKRRIPVLNWEESVASLNQMRHISLRLEDGQRKVFFIEDLPEGVQLDKNDPSLSEHYQKLDWLALSAHYALNPAVLRYKSALTLWASQDQERYHDMLQEAKEWETWAVERKQAAQDMLDWSVVNLKVRGGAESSGLLTNYIQTVRELEQKRLEVRREFQKEIFTE